MNQNDEMVLMPVSMIDEMQDINAYMSKVIEDEREHTYLGDDGRQKLVSEADALYDKVDNYVNEQLGLIA